MKVLIAYDGSEHADIAIDGLRRAGLPRGTEALVVSVSDPLANPPPISDFNLHSMATIRVDAALDRARNHRERVIREAEGLASEAVERLGSQFPEWKIDFEVLQGTPADDLLAKASEWQPDLIVVGSQGRSAIGRFFLGSVSKKLPKKLLARCVSPGAFTRRRTKLR